MTRGLSNSVVADGILYYGDDDGNVTAIRIANQTELWNMEHGSRIAVKLSVSKVFVFFGSEAGITALHRDRGTVAWTHAIVHGAGKWHFVVRPVADDDLISFFRWLTHTHVMRWRAHYHTEGTGHLYQGRFKTFPIQDDEYLYAVLRYVERNPIRANFCERAEDWKYGSAWRVAHGDRQL